MEENFPGQYEEDVIDLGQYCAILRKNWWKIALLSLAVGVADAPLHVHEAEHLPGDRGHHPLRR